MSWALVTGASSGIGLEFARVLAREGHNLILVARRKDRLAELKQELEPRFNIRAEVVAADLSKSEEVERVYIESQKFSTNLNVLVNNAGFGTLGYFHESDLSRELQMIDLNIRALTQLTGLVVPDMVKVKTGFICNVASTAAFQPGPKMSVYFASKAFVLSFSEALNYELKPHGIKVSALCPGPTESEFGETAGTSDTALMSSLKLPSSKEVAEYAYDSMKDGKSVAVHGFLNKLLVQSTRLAPRALTTAITGGLVEKV